SDGAAGVLRHGGDRRAASRLEDAPQGAPAALIVPSSSLPPCRETMRTPAGPELRSASVHRGVLSLSLRPRLAGACFRYLGVNWRAPRPCRFRSLPRSRRSFPAARAARLTSCRPPGPRDG